MRVQPRWQISRQANIRIDDLQGNAKHIRNSALPYLSSHRVNSAPTFVPAATFGQLTEATHGTIANTRAGKPRAVFKSISVLNQIAATRQQL
jgi:hypothetical protein